MLYLSRLNGSEFVLNAELIETLEATPDTIITLLTGKKLVVRESVDEVIQRIIQYRQAAGVRIPPRNEGGDGA